jgi:hypothetical protein
MCLKGVTLNDLKPRPWWLFWLPSWFWITLSPTIYHPKGVHPGQWPEIVAHERVHLRQQGAAASLWRWYLRYATSRAFRLAMEVEAIAEELAVVKWRNSPEAWERSLDEWAEALASWTYLWAARNELHARLELAEAIKRQEAA